MRGSATCPNCLEPAGGRYCASCGQEQDVSPRSLWGLLRDSFDDVLSSDGRLPRSLFALVFRPGQLTEEWRRGRRVDWSHPFRLYLLCSLAFFTLSLVIETHSTFTAGTSFSDDPGLRAAQVAAQQRALATVAPQTLILVVPLLALFLRVIFRGGFAYVEHVVHALHIQSFLFVLLICIFPATFLPLQVRIVALTVLILGFVGYIAASSRRVYGRPWGRTVVYAVVVSQLFLVASMSTLGGAVVLFQEDPEAPLFEAEEGYWLVHDRFASGDTTRMSAWGDAVADEYRLLAAYLVSARTRAHHAEAMLWADSAHAALTIARQGLVTDPDHVALLRVAGLAALAVSDTASAAEYGARFLSAWDGSVASDAPAARQAADLEAFRAIAARLGGG